MCIQEGSCVQDENDCSQLDPCHILDLMYGCFSVIASGDPPDRNAHIEGSETGNFDGIPFNYHLEISYALGH